MRKVPFMSLDLGNILLEETERSSDDGDDDILLMEEEEMGSVVRRERSSRTTVHNSQQQQVEKMVTDENEQEKLKTFDDIVTLENELEQPPSPSCCKVENDRIIVPSASSLLDLLASNKELSACPAVVDLVARVSEASSSPLGNSQGSSRTMSSPGGCSPTSAAQAPRIHRTPIPTEIYCIMDTNSLDERSDTDPQQQAEYDARYEILDPTDSLVYGLIQNPYVQQIAEQMNEYLVAAEEDQDIASVCQETTRLIENHPLSCQVKYKPPEFDSYCYPLSYFSAAGWLEGCQAAYKAFPEAIGQEQDSKIGLPLHYACLHQASLAVVQFLVDTYAEATRVTNAEHQTPLHQACRSKDVQLDVVELLLKHYPTAAQLADRSGYTPLHLAIRHGAPIAVLAALQASSPTVIRTVTLSWHRPLHIAALYGASFETIQWLVQKDPAAVRATGEDFSTVLHYAVVGHCTADVIAYLRDAYPVALVLTNEHDETPYDVALRVPGISPAVRQLLVRASSTSPCREQ